MSRDHVAFSLWPDSSESLAAQSLRTAVWEIQKRTRGLVSVDGGVIALATSATVDVHELRELAFAIPVTSMDQTVHRLIDSYSNEILPDWDEDWLGPIRMRWRETRLHALDQLALCLLNENRYLPAIEAALAATIVEPLRETSWHLLIRAHIAEGNSGHARRLFERFRELLQEEFDVEPSLGLSTLVGIPLSTKPSTDALLTTG